MFVRRHNFRLVQFESIRRRQMTAFSWDSDPGNPLLSSPRRYGLHFWDRPILYRNISQIAEPVLKRSYLYTREKYINTI